MEFIKKNKYLLCIILGIVSMALIISNTSSIYRTIQSFKEYGSEIPVHLIFLIINYICIFLAELIFVVIGYRKQMDKNLIMLSVVLYYASEVAYYVYQIFLGEDYSFIFSLIVSVLCIITVILALTNPRFLFSGIILLLIDSAFNLSTTFAGSTVGFSTLLLDMILIFTLILFNKNQDNDEGEYNIYS